MQLKVDENGSVALSDGKPVYVHEDGKELPFDAVGTVNTISRLNGEAKAHRERAEKAELLLKGFEGIEDPKKALEAMGIVQNLDAQKLVDAGKVDEIKAGIVKAHETKIAEMMKAHATQLAEINERANSFEAQFYNEKIGAAFGSSTFIPERVNDSIPPDMLRMYFEKNFKFENGRIVAYDNNGSQIYSKIKPGELAGFDESISALIDSHPNRDRLLKSSGASGSGATGGKVGSSQNTVKRDVFYNQWDGRKQVSFLKEGGVVVD